MRENWKVETPNELRLRRQARLLSYQRESGMVESIARVGWWGLCRSTFLVLNRLEIFGRENLPEKPPFVVVSNHSSHLDALILATMLPIRWRDQIFPLAAKDVFFDKPQVAGFATTFINAMPVWRTTARRHGLIELRHRLLSGESVYILFPEGTRTRTANKMGHFKPGVGMLVAGTPVPVLPCYLSGTFGALPPGSRMIRPGQIEVQVGRPIAFEDVPDDRTGWESVRSRVELAVRNLGASYMAAGNGGLTASDEAADEDADPLRIPAPASPASTSSARRLWGSRRSTPLEISPRFY